MGDTGTGDANQASVAAAMSAKCETAECDFALLLGDNFYPSGVSSVEDPLFTTVFEEPYADLDIPFYPTIGNHDADGNVQALIDYSAVSDKWNMPSRYYSIAYPDESAPLVELFAIDSTQFDDEQATWLSTTLANSTATWKILFDHYPYYSNGPHGDDSGGIATASAAIICNQVDLIISGHDHNKEHLVGTTGNCQFHQIVLGSGGAGLYEVTPDERTLFSISSFGFGWFQVSEDNLYFEFLDVEGQVEYSYQATQ